MPDADLQELIAESRRMEKDRPLLSALHLVLPLAILAATIILLKATGNLGTVSALAVASFFTLGKIIILSGAHPDVPLNAWELAAVVFYMDCLYAYILAYNLHHLAKIPRFGPWLARLHNYCRYWLSNHRWMKRWAFTGVMLFVLFPLTGTGAPGGSIIGRLVGLSARTTLFAIALGSALGCILMATFARPLEPILEGVQEEWWFEASGVAILAIVVLFVVYLGRKLSRAADEFANSEASGNEA
ncbi:MAG: small multi-drug export protein [Planctomycetota bacterium]|jgi:uncharacterized membrane protein